MTLDPAVCRTTCRPTASISGASTSCATDTTEHESVIKSDMEGASDTVSSNSTVVSLLDRLRSPTPAEIARTRKTKTNQPPKLYDVFCLNAYHNNIMYVYPLPYVFFDYTGWNPSIRSSGQTI